MTDAVEMLADDDETGHAVEGPRYPRDRGVVTWLLDGEADQQRLAYPHKFFKYDEHGQPMPETLMTFLVPDYMCNGAAPSRYAIRLVAERMGWA